MANITKFVDVDAPAGETWDAVADFFAIDERLLPGHVLSSAVEGDVRVLSIRDGIVLRERLIDLDHSAQRLAYTIQTDRIEHHNAVLQVHPLSKVSSRIMWSIDVLPHEIASVVSSGLDAQLALMAKTIRSGRTKPR